MIWSDSRRRSSMSAAIPLAIACLTGVAVKRAITYHTIVPLYRNRRGSPGPAHHATSAERLQSRRRSRKPAGGVAGMGRARAGVVVGRHPRSLAAPLQEYARAQRVAAARADRMHRSVRGRGPDLRHAYRICMVRSVLGQARAARAAARGRTQPSFQRRPLRRRRSLLVGDRARAARARNRRLVPARAAGRCRPCSAT